MNLFSDPNASPLAIAKQLDDADRAWRSWDPSMLREHCKLGADDVQQLDKVLATQVAVTNPDVFDDPFLFNHAVIAFNGRRVNFEYLDVPSLAEAAWGCFVLRSLATHSFGPGVLKYLVALCLNEGLLYFPWVGGTGLRVTTAGSGDPAAPDFAPWAKGLSDPMPGVEDSLADLVARGALSATIGDIDERDLMQAQLAKIVAINQYVEAAKAWKGES